MSKNIIKISLDCPFNHIFPLAVTVRWKVQPICTVCGHLPTPLVDSQTSRVYSSNPVRFLYIMHLSINQCCRTSCCASFHSGDPDQVAPFVLYTIPLHSHGPLAPPRDSPGTVFLPGEEVFSCPGLAVPSQPPQMRYPFRQQAPPQRLDL
jgi:hypothetical protein